MGLGGAQLVFVTDPRLVAEVFRKSKELDKDWRLLAPFSQARGLRRSLTCPRPGWPARRAEARRWARGRHARLRRCARRFAAACCIRDRRRPPALPRRQPRAAGARR